MDPFFLVPGPEGAGQKLHETSTPKQILDYIFPTISPLRRFALKRGGGEGEVGPSKSFSRSLGFNFLRFFCWEMTVFLLTFSAFSESRSVGNPFRNEWEVGEGG